MKKTIKIFFAVFMSLLIICFSCVSAFADTTVDSGSTLDLNYFKNNVFKSYLNSNASLADLPSDNYLVFVDYSETSSNGDEVIVTFVPSSGKKVNYLGEFHDDYSAKSKIVGDDIYIYYIHPDNYYYPRVAVNCPIYQLYLRSSNIFFKVNDDICNIAALETDNGNGFKKAPHVYVNNADVSNMLCQVPNFSPFSPHISTNKHCFVFSCSSLFSYVVQIVPGYSGHIVDTSFDGLLSEKGITCDNSILNKYKYQIAYLKNNDIVMMFLNNNKKPDLKIEDYNDGINTNSKKYTFTYNSSYDTVVYFPQFQKYLNYDDWYNSDCVPKDFRWFWTEDKKSFSLISDWNVSFDDTGKASYNGTRVVVNWKLDESSIDNISLTKSWQVDKEMLKDKGWKEGRPSDQNYPYCVQLWQNNIPIYSVYFNSKPKVRINRESDYYCEYAIDMVGMCGYVYSEWADMSTQFDFTTGKVAKGSDMLSQGQNLVWYLFNDLGGRADDSCLLHLYDNYKGNDEHFVGTKVFFNWDVTSNTFDTNLKNDDYDYSKTLLKGGSYKDENGHIHGGDLKQYDDEDLNKWNTNGKDDDSNKNNSSDFDFSFEGITEYCKDFWSFMQSSLAIFPSFVWLLVGASIAVLIALRLLGR